MSSLGLIIAVPLEYQSCRSGHVSRYLSVPVYTDVPCTSNIVSSLQKHEGETNNRPNLISQLKAGTPLVLMSIVLANILQLIYILGFLRGLISISRPEVAIKHFIVVVVLMIRPNTSGGSIGTSKYQFIHLALGLRTKKCLHDGHYTIVLEVLGARLFKPSIFVIPRNS